MIASRGLATLLTPSEQTTHSKFAVPINIDESSTHNIIQGSPLAKLIIRAIS